METDRDKAHGLGHARDLGPDAGSDRGRAAPRGRPRPRRPHRDLPARTGARRVRRRTRRVFVSHISSGDNSEWCEEVTIGPGEIGNEDGTEPLKRGECGDLDHARRRVPVQAPGRSGDPRGRARGRCCNPVYFNYGIAVHGATTCRCIRRRTAASGSRTHISEWFQGSSRSATWSTCGTAWRSPRSTASDRDSQPISTTPIPTTRRPPRRTTTTTTTTTTVVPDHRAAGHHHDSGGHHDHPAGDDYDLDNRRPADPLGGRISDRSALTPARSGQTSATRRGGADL